MKKVIFAVLSFLTLSQANALESVSSGGKSSEVNLNMRLSIIEQSLRAQVDQLELYLAGVRFCNDQGLLYGPENANRDANGCVRAAEKDPLAKNYAYEHDAASAPLPSERVGELGMDTCPDGEFVTSNGTADVRCVPVEGGVVIPPSGSCASTVVSVGTCNYTVNFSNGETGTFECEDCNIYSKKAVNERLSVSCVDGVLHQTPLSDQTCTWGNLSDICQFAPSCKPAKGTDCTGKIELAKNNIMCETQSIYLKDEKSNVYSCTSGNVTLSQAYKCSLGTLVSLADVNATAYCKKSNVLLKNANDASQYCHAQVSQGDINDKIDVSCKMKDAILSSRLLCNYKIAPETDTKWRAGPVSIVEGCEGDSLDPSTCVGQY